MDDCVSIQCAFAFQSIEKILGLSAWFFSPKGILDANIQHGVLNHGSHGNRSAGTEGGWRKEPSGLPQPFPAPRSLVHVAVKWAGLCLGRLFASRFRVAKGVSVTSVVNLPTNEPPRLIRVRRFWYNLCVRLRGGGNRRDAGR